MKPFQPTAPSKSVEVNDANAERDLHISDEGGVQEGNEEDLIFSTNPQPEGDDNEELGSDGEAADDNDAGEAAGADAASDEIEGTLAEIPETKDLGEYKDEATAEWDKEYTTASGEPNIERLSAEWWNAYKASGDKREGKLNAGTYAYLKKKFNVGDATIKQIEKNFFAETTLKARDAAAAVDRIVEAEGGFDAINAAIEWAKKGGYSKEQRARFNQVRNSGKSAEIQDSLAALMARFTKAGGTVPTRGQTETNRGGRNVSAAAPAGGGPAKGDVYKDKAEWQAEYSTLKTKFKKGSREWDENYKRVMDKMSRSPFMRKPKR